MKSRRILVLIFAGFMMPPALWLLILIYSGIFTIQETIKIASSPVLGLYVISYVTGIMLYSRKQLHSIIKYKESSDPELLEQSQKSISRIPLVYFVSSIIYSAIGPNTGLIVNLSFVSGQDYLYAWLLGIPTILLLSTPVFTLITMYLEEWTGDIPKTDLYKNLSINFKLAVNILIPVAGVTIILVTFTLIGITVSINDVIHKLIVIGLFGFLVTLLNFFSLSSQLSRPLRDTAKKLEEMASGEGDLKEGIKVRTKDEIGSLCENFNAFMDELKKIIMNLIEVADQNLSVSKDLAANSSEASESSRKIQSTLDSFNDKNKILDSDIHNSAEAVSEIKKLIIQVHEKVANQSVSLNQSFASIEEMINSIDKVQNVVKDENRLIKELSVSGTTGEEYMGNTVVSIQEIATSADVILELIHVIDKIASQTNLLSMNAAIEAAHAGDSGKGFGVVADEIRKLAESTANNSKEISVSLKGIINKISETSSLTLETSGIFSKILSNIKEVSDGMIEMEQSMNEMSLGSVEIKNTSANLIKLTQDVKESSDIMNDRAVNVEKHIFSLGDISRENVSALTHINNSVEEITGGLEHISILGQNNSDNVGLLEKVIKKFNI